MAADFEIRGFDEILALSKALKHAGETEMRKGLGNGLKQGVRPLIPLMSQAALSKLPKRGGLAARMAKRPITPVVRTGKDPGVGLVMRKAQPGFLTGEIRHPAFKPVGPVKVPWAAQRVDGVWFDGTVMDNAHVVMPGLKAAVNDVLEQIVREAT